MPLTSHDLLCCLLLVALCLTAGCHALTVKVLAQSEECFSETVDAGGRISVAFEVTHGGKLDLNAYAFATVVDDGLHPDEEHDGAGGSFHGVRRHAPRVSISDGHTLVRQDLERWNLATRGEATFQSKSAAENQHGLPSKLTICFDNTMSRWTPKWVDFSFVKMEVAHERAGAQAAAASSAGAQAKLEHAIHAEGVSLFNLHGVMQRVRTREQEHRTVVESTNTWILWGTIVNVVMVVVMAVFQYWYLKTFLSVRSVTMRI